jgi:hypothetical protein
MTAITSPDVISPFRPEGDGNPALPPPGWRAG